MTLFIKFLHPTFVMSTQKVLLREQLNTKSSEIQYILQKVSALNSKINRLAQKYHSEASKLQIRIDKVQFSRPRGNPSDLWPHCPMTDRVRLFYQNKERKERSLRADKNLLKMTFDHSRAILLTQRLNLENAQRDLESQIRLIQIRFHL